MKIAIMFLTLILHSSCQWVLSRPEEDTEAVGVIEEVVQDLYQYESRTLSPSPPPGVPPMKPIGPTGPSVKPGVQI